MEAFGDGEIRCKSQETIKHVQQEHEWHALICNFLKDDFREDMEDGLKGRIL